MVAASGVRGALRNLTYQTLEMKAMRRILVLSLLRITLLYLLIGLTVLAGCGRAAPAAPVAAADAPAAAIAAPTTIAPAAEGEGMLPMVNPLEVTGDILMAGSSTVFPLAERMAERFKDEGYSGNITIDSIGSGAGFERFCVAGESDIANASRAIRDSEVESCQAINRTPIEFRVGTDALAVVVNPANEFLTDVTLEQLATIFSNNVTKWNEVDPSWPDAEIKRFSPGTDSGTFDYFVEAVMTPAFEAEGEDAGETALLDAANLQLSEDDNVLVQGVEGDVNAIGYFGYAYYQEEADRLKLLNIEGVEATESSVDAGEYALARPLFIYSDATILREKPQVASFVNFFLTYVNEEAVSVGYFPASAEALQTAMQAWLDAAVQ
jgi:phosphate binding protein